MPQGRKKPAVQIVYLYRRLFFSALLYLSLGKLSFEEIAIGSGLSLEEVEELADLQLV